MTAFPAARLCYITETEPDTFVLTLQFAPMQERVTEVTINGSRLERVKISREQYSNIVKDGVKVLR